MPANPQVTLTSSKIKPLDPLRAETIAVRLPAGVTLPAGQVLEEVNTAAANRRIRALLGTCAGFQHGVVEFARNACGIRAAEHAEYGEPDGGLFVINELAC